MNKLLTKVARLALGLSLAAGVGVAIGSKAAVRTNADTTGTHTIGWGTADTDETFASTSGTVTFASGHTASFSTAKNSSQNAPAYNSTYKELRLYYASNGSGGSVTFTCSDVTITGAVITTSSNSPTMKYSVNGGSTTSINKSNGVYTISGISASTSLMIQNGNTSNTQLQIRTIEFSYSYSGGVAPTLSGITVKTAPDKVVYSEGEYFDPTGLVITRTYSDSSTSDYSYNDHTSDFTFAPTTTTMLTTSNSSVTIGYGGKTCAQAITVNEIPAPLDDGDYYIGFNVNGTTYYANDASSVNSYGAPLLVGASSATKGIYTIERVSGNIYTITLDDNYLIVGKNDNNGIKFSSTLNDQAKWTVTKSSDTYTFKNVGYNTRYLSNYSSTDVRCYTSSCNVILEVPVVVVNHTISFNAGSHASGTKASLEVAEGDYTLPTYEGFTPETGYIFTGWKANNAGNTLTAGSSYSVTADVTFYAQWVLGVGLNYNANGGTGTMDTTYVISGESQTVAACTFTAPSGKVFNHWNTSESDNGTSYSAGATISNYTSAITLYAIWEETISYTLVSDPTTLTDGTTFVLVGYASSTYRIANGLNGAHEKMNEITAATSISNGVNAGSTLITSEADVFTLVGSSGSWEIKRDNTYLSFTGTSNGNDSFEAESGANALFTISGDETIDIISNAQSDRYWRYNTSTGDLRNGNSSYGTDVYMFANLAPEKEITAQRIGTVGTVSATNGDAEWTISGFAFQVQYDNQSEWVTIDNSQVEYSVNIAVPTITQNDTVSVNVTGTYKEVTATANNVTATLTYVNPYTLYSIERLYSAELPGNYYSDGIYMGEVADGYIFMNGEYGVLVYNNTHSLSLTIGGSYTIYGQAKYYNGLLEYVYSGTTVTELSDSSRRAAILTPVTYTVVGNETADKANRKTELTGYVKSMSSTAQNANSTVVFNVNGSDITVYVKAAQATEKNMTALSGNMTANDGKTQDFVLINLEGFTGWFNGFQVSLTQVVVADNTYTIYDFARSLLKETLTVCTGGDHDNTSNKSALTAIWGELKGASYYGSLTDARKSDLAAGTANSAVVVPGTSSGIDNMSDSDALGAALYRYDYCTAKYNLEEFIVGRTLSVSFGNNISLLNVTTENTNTIAIIVIISMVSVTAIGGYFFIKRRKAN